MKQNNFKQHDRIRNIATSQQTNQQCKDSQIKLWKVHEMTKSYIVTCKNAKHGLMMFEPT